MIHSDTTREIAIDQGHLGTLVLAGLLAVAATFGAVVGVMAVVWQLSLWSAWLLCLFMPGVGLVMLVGMSVLHWGERNLSRLWPSSRRLLLDTGSLTLKRRSRVENQIEWHRPFEALRWRVLGRGGRHEQEPGSAPLSLACELRQNRRRISIYTVCSLREWRRVPGWKQFPALGDAAVIGPRGKGMGWSAKGFNRRMVGPPQRVPISLPQLNPDTVWPAERFRRYRGWMLAFEDFCAVMAAVEKHSEPEEQDA